MPRVTKPQDDLQEGEEPVEAVSVERRLSLVERDTQSHARTITEIVNTLQSHGSQLEKLDAWQMTRLLAEVREEERDKALYSRLDLIDESIRSMRGVWTRIMWIAAGTVVPAVVAGVALLLVFGANIVFGLK